jgi:hypothetical protein
LHSLSDIAGTYHAVHMAVLSVAMKVLSVSCSLT